MDLGSIIWNLKSLSAIAGRKALATADGSWINYLEFEILVRHSWSEGVSDGGWNFLFQRG
jgi:hypothetical protein